MKIKNYKIKENIIFQNNEANLEKFLQIKFNIYAYIINSSQNNKKGTKKILLGTVIEYKTF